MSKKLYYKERNRLFTPYEIKVMAIPKSRLKKVYRSVDEITDTEEFGRLDKSNLAWWQFPSVSEISTKQLRNPKINRQMIALGLL